MAFVVTLEDYKPSPRYDGNAWTSVRVEEGTAAAPASWTNLGTIAFGTVDPDPTNPMYRNFTIENGTAADLWYRLTFLDATGDQGLPTTPVQNTAVGRPVYATIDELAALLRVSASSRHAALRRVLEAAATEIDDEIGATDINGNTIPYGSPPALVSEVNLERAVEHWQQMQSPFGVIGMGEIGATYTARDSWDRHAHKLSPLKNSWGLS
jgi:hypothetical protein